MGSEEKEKGNGSEGKEAGCQHERDQLHWEAEPNVELSPGDTLLWFGSCVCGQRVVEEYNSIGIFTADTDSRGDLEHDRVFISE